MKRPTRREAWARWHRLATGHHDEDTLTWIKGVASALLRADELTDANKRRMAMQRALGLTGHSDTDAHAIRLLMADHGADHFKGLKGRRELRDIVVAMLKLDDASDEAIDARIKRALEEK